MAVILNWASILLIIITATGLLFSQDWRWKLGLLAAQYLGVFWMVQVHWTISSASTKLVTGWMACAVLGIAQLSVKTKLPGESNWLQAHWFHIFSTGMVLAITFAVSTPGSAWLSLPLPVTWGGLALIGMGLLQLGITSDPFRVILGLLTFLSGFEILYSAVESSALVAALLAVISLGLALAGAYFLNVTQEKSL